MTLDLDLDRIGEWLHAVERWELGDARAVVEFVRRYGIQTAAEREGIARMLTTKPDPRRKVKKHTEIVLRELNALLRRRHYLRTEFPVYMQRHVERLRRRLSARGVTDEQIDALLRRRRPMYMQPAPTMTLDDIYTALATRHGVEPESIKKLHRRHR